MQQQLIKGRAISDIRPCVGRSFGATWHAVRRVGVAGRVQAASYSGDDGPCFPLRIPSRGST